MKSLLNVGPTPEQLAIFSRLRSGAEVIRGAAGSGKTTTAILKLRSNVGFFLGRRKRLAKKDPIHILVLTFNRTLRGYIESLVLSQLAVDEGIELTISTFGKWAHTALGEPVLLDDAIGRRKILTLGRDLGLEDYLLGEVEYITGRYLPEHLDSYLTARRDGRGNTPRVDKALRERLINEVIRPYEQWKMARGENDWNDLAVQLARKQDFQYDVVVIDEAQDFSANQLRAVLKQLKDEHSITFVLDTAQRIYARGFTWSEVGVAIRPENSHRLENNYRNTKQIAAFASSLLNGIEVDDDLTLPNMSKCRNDGPKPLLLKGRFAAQLDYVLTKILSKIDLVNESVAFLHPLGGEWFREIRTGLDNSSFPFVELSRQAEWPTGPENVALSTLHSSKGLEFDHVIILGLNAEVLPHGEMDHEDDRNVGARKLLAMGICRARKSIILGYKPEDKSSLVDWFSPSTYDEAIV